MKFVMERQEDHPEAAADGAEDDVDRGPVLGTS